MDPTAFHILVQLVRKGVFDLDDCLEIAGRLTEEGEERAAHAARAAFVEADMEPDSSEPIQLRLVSSNRPADGGNEAST